MKIVIAVFCTVLFLTACSGQDERAPELNTQSLQTISVQAQNKNGQSIWDGVIEAVQQVQLTAQTTGRVSKVLVDVNDQVKTDDLLVQLSAVEQQAGVNTSQAQLNAAKAQAIAAQNSYIRYESLVKKQYISKQQFDQALSERNAANAQVAALQSQLIQANQQTAYTQIRAPFDGIISDRFIEPGESITIGQAIVSVFNPENLRIEVQVPQSMAESLRAEPVAMVEVADGTTIQVNEIIVFPSADGDSHSVKVRIQLPKKTAVFKPGQVVKVVFAVPASKAITFIPRSAVWQRGELSAVYVVTDKNIFLRQVRLGEIRGESIELISGVSDGERIALVPTQAAELLVQFKAKAVVANE
ncbi:MAG TPA: efflux RND transporter periplasmic adaptor subunit [Arenimonas sp.]|nr:efflux RND transporter periplasmic adaptor subunit [Arenimonas sp.]